MRRAMKSKCKVCNEYRLRTDMGASWTGFYTCSCGTISIHEGRHEEYGDGFIWLDVEE
jgi:hypothetical protein